MHLPAPMGFLYRLVSGILRYIMETAVVRSPGRSPACIAPWQAGSILNSGGFSIELTCAGHAKRRRKLLVGGEYQILGERMSNMPAEPVFGLPPTSLLMRALNRMIGASTCVVPGLMSYRL